MMDFVSGLLRSSESYDSLCVIVDRLTISAHFLHVRITNLVHKLAKLYLKEIECLHSIPVSITSDQDARFTFTFWRELRKGFGTRLKFSTNSHYQSMEKVNRPYKPSRTC